jgi:mitogen-activated protein kinase 1/3
MCVRCARLQLRLIIDVLGTPSEDDLSCITNQQAVQFLRTLPVKARKPWSEVFPNASPQALMLLERMLVFNPEHRCSMVDSLNSEYMAALHQNRELPEEEKQFSFGFEKPEITQDELRALIWNEMASFHPELPA